MKQLPSHVDVADHVVTKIIHHDQVLQRNVLRFMFFLVLVLANLVFHITEKLKKTTIIELVIHNYNGA